MTSSMHQVILAKVANAHSAVLASGGDNITHRLWKSCCSGGIEGNTGGEHKYKLVVQSKRMAIRHIDMISGLTPTPPLLSINMSASDPRGRCFFCISCNNKYNPRKCFVEFRNSALTTSIQRTRNTAIVVASSTSIFCIEF